jgi:aromatic ring hydroxylase
MSLQRRWIVDLMRALRELGGGGFIALPSAESFESPETAEDVQRYFRSAALPARDRVRLLRLLWDLVGTEFGGRQLRTNVLLDHNTSPTCACSVPTTGSRPGACPAPGRHRES